MNLKDLLAERKITCAHIIDDAFDEAPGAGLSPETIEVAFGKIQPADYTSLCLALQLPEDDESEIKNQLEDATIFASLYKQRSVLTLPLHEFLFHDFEVEREGKLQQLTPLLDMLKSLDVECCTFGADYDPTGKNIPQLFFVDLKLRENSTRQVHEDAKDALASLQRTHVDAKPFVFLMSSQPLQLGASKEDFRKSAKLFQSEFESVNKAFFNKTKDLENMIARYTSAMDVHLALHQSMQHVQVAVSNAATKVIDELRALDFSDYFVLHKNTTSVEKIDLGSYVVELLLEFLANEVEGKEKVWDLAAELNRLELSNLRRINFGWSDAAMRLYSASMLHNKELLRAEERMKNDPSHGYFFTGDIYFDAKGFNEGSYKRAKAIITPACDLVRPSAMSKKSVLLCEGVVERVINANPKLMAEDGLSVTLMHDPKDEGKFLTVTWNKKKIHVWDDEARLKFSKEDECPYLRVGRLKPLYALQLQQKVTSDLSRVGTQKPPSTLNMRGFSCLVSDGSKWDEIYLNTSADAAAWIFSEETEGKKKVKTSTVLLADATLQQAMEKIQGWLQERPELPSKAKFEKILSEDTHEKLRVSTSKWDADVEEAVLFPLKDLQEAALQKSVVLVRNVKASSPYSYLKDGAKFKEDMHEAHVVFKLLDVE